ncbi:MAG: LamG domain-containing protein, partial [Myxococcota bacterium]|nr:LamG domain-containing protein [Myxococcota bacterium]
FVTTHHPVTFSDENNLGGTGGDFWQLLVGYGTTGLFTGHWHRYQPSQPGAGGSTWETIIGTAGGWQGFEPIREYQQIPGFLLVEVDGGEAVATFYGDSDGDGNYDNPLDSYTMAWEGETPSGLRARYTFDDGTADDSADVELGGLIHGTLEGDASIVASEVSGKALSLDGDQDYVEAGSIGDYVLAIKEDLTLSLWAQPTTVVSDSWGSVLLSYATNDYYTEDEETNYSYWLSLLEDGSLLGFWEYGSGSNISVSSTETSTLLDGDWHHVAMVRDADAMEARFYVDGDLLGLPVAFDRLPTGGGRGMLYMGVDTRYYLGSYDLGGTLDEICIFDQALDEDQIAGLADLQDCEEVASDAGGDTGEEPQDTGQEPQDTGEPPGGDTAEPTETAEPQDTGESQDGDEVPASDGKLNSGCTCSTTRLDRPSAAWWVLGLLGLVIRRRLPDGTHG